MRNLIFAFLVLVTCTAVAETITEIENLAGITAIKREHGLTGKGVAVVVHDGFDLTEGEKISHGQIVDAIIKSVAPAASIINMTSIFLKPQFTDVRVSPELTARYIADKYQPKIVNLSWGANYFNKFFKDFKNSDLGRLSRELARFGIAVVIAAGNEQDLAGTNKMTTDQAQVIDEINNDPTISGGIVLVGAGEIFSPQKRNLKFADELLASYSTMAGVSRNHYVVGGPKFTAANNENTELFLEKGTSFATPVVTGILALLAEKFPQATGKALIQLLFGGVTELRDVYENPAVKQILIERLTKTTNLPKEHWRKLQWFDIFGRGVVNAKTSVDLGQKIFARKTVIFPNQADMKVYDNDTSYITKANSLWPLFNSWQEKATRNLAKQTAAGRTKAIFIVREYLWPFMQLWHGADLPFSAKEKYEDIALLLLDAGDVDFALDVFLDGLYYLEIHNADKTSFEEMLTQLFKKISSSLGKSAKDDYLNRALQRFSDMQPDFDSKKKWSSLLKTLFAIE